MKLKGRTPITSCFSDCLIYYSSLLAKAAIIKSWMEESLHFLQHRPLSSFRMGYLAERLQELNCQPRQQAHHYTEAMSAVLAKWITSALGSAASFQKLFSSSSCNFVGWTHFFNIWTMIFRYNTDHLLHSDYKPS